MSDEKAKESFKEAARGRLEQILEKGGDFVLDQGAVDTGTVDLTTDTIGNVAPEVVVAQVPEAADSDPLMRVGTDSAQASLTLPDGLLPETVEIKLDDKEAFVSAILTDSRYRRPFSLYGGRVVGELMSRTAREHDGIIAYMAKLIRDKVVVTDGDYGKHLRALCLTAHVARYMETEYKGLVEPVFSGDDGTAPGWDAAYRRWLELDNRQPGITGPLFGEIKKFERKYWTLISCAGDANFFGPAGSV